MTEIAERYRRNAGGFTDKLAAVPSDGWGTPTPCEDWDVQALVAHVVGSQGMILGLVGRELDPSPSVDDDPVAAWVAARDRIQHDLEDPELASEEFDGFFGRSTFAQAVDRFLSSDLVIHGWDLSRAIGLDETIDPAEIETLVTTYAAMGDSLHLPGVCAPAIEPAPDADAQTRLLNELGREV